MFRDSPAAAFWTIRDKVALKMMNDAVWDLHLMYETLHHEPTKYTLDRVVDDNGVGPLTERRRINALISRSQVDAQMRCQYFKARTVGASEMTASRVTLVDQQQCLVSLWSVEAHDYLVARMSRFLRAFTCPGDLTHQSKLYLVARGQLRQSHHNVSGSAYWQDIWCIPDHVWRQLQDECETINAQRPWSHAEYRTYAAITFGVYRGHGWQCRSRYFSTLYPDAEEP